jgi:hypothetical protein
MKTLAPRIISHAGVSVDLAQVKCFKLSNFSGIGKQNTLTIEFKKRIEYILNPSIGEYVKEELNDATEITFPEYEIARAYTTEWEEIWQDYLDGNL